MDCSLPGSVHGDFPGKNTELGCHFLLEGIFLIQGLNSSPAWQADSLPLNHLRSSHKKNFSNKFENTGACSVVIVIRSTDSFSVIIESDIEY